MSEHLLEWTRLVLPEDDFREDSARFVEIAVDGLSIYVRKGRLGAEGSVEVTQVKTAEAAARGLRTRVETLVKKGWLRDDPVRKPKPPDPAVARERAEADRRDRVEHFRRVLPAFFEAWAALGYEPSRTFQQEGQRRGRDWNAVAAECLALAARTFDVSFTGRMDDADPEHGSPGPIGRRDLAEFHRDPAKVARLAREKLRGRYARTDGAWHDSHLGYASEDEVTEVLRRFVPTP
jgi:predicted DNA-binding WGR domain protein